MLNPGIPTIDDILQKWRESRTDVLAAARYFSEVAGGQRGSMLRGNDAIFAAQTVMILINHFLELEKSNATNQKTATEESNNCQGQEQPSDSTT